MKNSKTIDSLYNGLHSGYVAFAQANGTGDKKREKRKLINGFISQLLKHTLTHNHLHASYEMKSEYEVNITPNFSISLDSAIVNKKDGNVVYHIEDKDYMDVDMAKRFLVDSYYLMSKYPNVINIGLSLQPASPKQTIIDATNNLGLKYGKNVFFVSLVDIMRSSQKQNWFSEVKEADMKDAIDEVITSLTQIIQ